MKFTEGTLLAAILVALVLAAVPAQAQDQEGGQPARKSVSSPTLGSTRRHFKEGRYESAILGLKRILADQEYKDDPEFLNMMGVCLLAGENPKRTEARNFFNRVIERDQNFPSAYFGLARTYVGGEDQEVSEAKRYLIEAMKRGYDVLGKIRVTPDFEVNKSINGPDFTRLLLAAQTEFVFENLERRDPFYVPRELLDPGEGDAGGKVWNRNRQEGFIRKLEELWEEASRLIDMEDQDQVDQGLDKYRELVTEISKYEEKITHPDFRTRLADIKDLMEEKKFQIKNKILNRYIEDGTRLVTAMKLALAEKDYEEVIRLFDEDLVPLTDDMVATDEDFRETAEEILGLGQGYHEEATVGLEIQALQLEVVGIVIAPGLEETDEFGKETGMHKRATIILNQTEVSDKEPPDPDFQPRQRKYFIDDTINQIDELKITKIERNKVVCLYKNRYEVDLDLKRPGASKEPEK